MSIAEWKDFGIPEGYGPHRLLYNAPSETIIIELRSIGNEFSPNRIYIRRKDDPKYEPIKSFEPMDSYESVVSSSGRPMLFYLSYRITKREDHYGADWLGLYCFEIPSRTETEIVGKDSLLLPPPYNRGWVSALVSASEDASTLVLTVGMTVEDDSPGFHKVDYHLASMHLETRQLQFISQLKGCFF
jgi:hypothetical protein